MSKSQIQTTSRIIRSEITQEQEFSLSYPIPSSKDVDDILKKLKELSRITIPALKKSMVK